MGHTTNDLLERLLYYLLDLSLLDYKRFVSTSPSLLTASAVYLSRATLGISEVPIGDRSCARKMFWSKTLEYYTSYAMKDLECTVKDLCMLHEEAEGNEFRNVYKKHTGSSQRGSIAHRIVLNESDLGFKI